MSAPNAPLKRQAAVIGAGPAGLIAAEVLAQAGLAVTVYDRMSSPARKFLMAGRGGLNLTHSEPLNSFLNRYGEAAPRLRDAVMAFPPEALRAWCEGLGQPTFVGTSGRVFPASLKASPLLRAWLRRLDDLGVRFALRHEWRGWDDAGWLRFLAPQGEVSVAPEITVLALGGASWPRLGSDGGWVAHLRAAGITVSPLKPSNCGVIVAWSDVFRERFSGHPLKRIALTFADRSVRGEAVVTTHGLEGGAVYALSPLLRDASAAHGEALLQIDLRPDLSLAEVERRLAQPRGKQSLSTFLRKSLALPPVAIGLVHETLRAQAASSPQALAPLIKAVPIAVSGIASLGRAISTAGGLTFDELDTAFMLRRRPGVFAAGEMLDWEAPTGGYLLQACFATGVAAARGALRWFKTTRHM